MKLIKTLPLRFNNLPYRKKLLITHSLVLVVPIIVLGFYSFYQSRKMLINSKLTDIDYYFSRASAGLNEAIENSENVIDKIKNNPTMSSVLNYESEKSSEIMHDAETVLSPFIYNAKQNYRYIREVTFYSATARPAFRSIIRPRSEFNISEFRKSNNGDFNWFYNEKMIILSRAIVMADEYKGDLTIQINPQRLLETTASPNFFNYNIALFSEDGGCIYSSILPKDKALIKDINEVFGTEENTKFGGKDFLIKSIKLENGFVLTAFVNQGTFLVGIKSILITTLIFLLICLFFSTLLALAFSNTLTKRITVLNNEINRVKTGDLDISVHSDYSDEIGNLTNNFDNMIRHINRLIEDIRESEHIQKKAELKALQAQIKPHFLYNVLQAVNWNAIDKGDTETSLIVVNLSNFYRAVLNKGDDDISVEKELKIVEYYINVEKAIYGDIFKVAYNIDEGIKNCLAIPLILQPLVENAIEHGIRSLAEPHGEIAVSAYAEGETLVFTVSDNGAGIPPQKTDTILTKATSGYGLKNINERIKLRFGEEYGLRLTSPRSPTVFTITLPLIPLEPQ